jgi:hypothetical protein
MVLALPSGIACRALAEDGHSDLRDNGLRGLAGRAIVCAQIETRFLRFDTGQYQRPAAFGAGRPKVIDELKFERVYHSRDESWRTASHMAMTMIALAAIQTSARMIARV